MADLQELFARLNGQSSAGSSGNQASAGYQQPSVSSPIFSPSPNGPQPHHASAIISPNMSAANTPGPEQPQPTAQQQSAQLLNLLRFNSQPSAPQHSIPPHRRAQNNSQAADSPGSHGRQVSASDLVASFMGKTSPPAASPSVASLPAARPEQASVSSENPQDLLLRLLQPKPQTDAPRSSFSFATPSSVAQAPETAVDDLAQDLADAKLEKVPSDPHAAASASSPMRVFGSDGVAHSSSFEPEAAAKPKFTYVNPFEKLEAASPRNRTPAPSSSKSPTLAAAPKVEILKPKHGLDGVSSVGSDAKDQHTDKSRRLSPGPSAHPHETVAEAVSDLGEQVVQQVEQALAEAESKSEALTAKDMERLSPEAVKEVEEVIVETAVEIKKELEDPSEAKALEETVGKPIAEALKEVASEVAQADIADSWESAEAEDSPTKDEEQTVIVYQFPMRAFASLTVQNMPQRRATFRPELIMGMYN